MCVLQKQNKGKQCFVGKKQREHCINSQTPTRPSPKPNHSQPIRVSPPMALVGNKHVTRCWRESKLRQNLLEGNLAVTVKAENEYGL